jgi:putative transposase
MKGCPDGKAGLWAAQSTSYDWQDFLKAHNLTASMSRRGNCYDNAVAESFF